MVKLLQKFYIILCFSFIYSVNSAQLQVNNIGANADFLANVIAGQGVSISNATIVGHNQAYSTFNYNGTSYCVGGVSPNVPGILTGVLLTTGRANIAPGPNNNGGAGASNGTAGTALLGGNTFDAVVLEFDFVPSSDFISFRYVFGSEEYNEYVGSSFNDAFGFFVSGPNPLGGNYNDLNIALLPNSSVVSINNVNLNTNSAFYINNEAPNVQNNCVQYDGYTTVLTASANVIPCQTYRLKLAIADVGDGVYDSGVFIEENSLTSPSVSVSLSVPPVIGQNNVLYEGCDYLTMTLSIPNPVAINTTVNYTLGGTATNGTDYTGFPSSIVIPAGQTSTSFNITAFEDGIPEGVETIIVNVDITPCSTETFIIEIHDAQPLVVNTSNNVSVCFGATTADLTATANNPIGPVTYEWNPGALTGQNVTVTNPTNGQVFTVTATDLCGRTSNASTTVVFQPQIIPSAGPDQNICLGDNITLTGSGGTSYIWYQMPGNVQIGTGANITVSPTATTTYMVEVFQGTCSETAEVTITVNPPPAAVASLSNNNICVGQSATLSASGATSYLWTANPPLPGLDPTATTQTVAPTQTTTFTLEATESGCTGESSVTLTVNPLPDINATASPADICLGESTQLNAQNAVSYSWTANPSDASLAGQTNIASPTVSPQTTTTYSVTGVDGNGCSNSSTVTVNVSTVQGVVASSPTPVICAGQQTTLNGSGANTYQWTDAQTGVPVGSGASITVNPTSTTTYLLTGFVGTCSGTDQLTITVNPLPIVSANASNSPICNGQSTTLNASGAATYLWQANPVDPSLLPVSNTPNPTVTPTQTTTYNLVGIDANNCPNTASVTVVVNALPNVSATVSPTAICLNQSAQLNASGAVNYQWTATPSDASLNTQNTIANPTVTPNNTTTYQVMGTDANGCSSTSTITLTVNPLPNITATVSNAEICDGESTQLQASGASNYFWTSNPNDVTLQNQNTLMNPTVTPAIGTTTYSVTGTDSNNCSGSANVTVNVLPFANITVTPSSLSICEGETVTLTAQGGTTFTWTQNPMDASFQTSPNGSNAISSPIQNTTYTVTGSATGLCASSTDVSIEVRPQPNASFTVSGPVCERDDYAAINFTGNAIAGANFDWNFDNGNTANAGGFHNYLSMWSTPGSKNISLTITQNGCTHTVNQTIMVNPKPIASGTAQPAVGCEPLLVNFTNTSTYNNLPNNVTWFFGNGSSSNGLGNVSTVYQNAGAYDVTLMVENNFGCRDTVTYNNMVTVNPLPVALFNYMPDVITVNNPNISLLDNSINSVSCDYFINGVWVSNNCNYNHTFKDSGEYVIMQLVTSQDGCVDTMFQTVYVLPDGNIYIPNAFSPNGDGVNDIFKAEGFGVAEFKMEIYNRWGETLYTIDRIADGWDGKLNGVDLKQDVYVYRIEYSTTLDPKIKILIGRFNLLR